jgi:indolepyruvate ferredoxin oxidoreductase beta subunit
MAGFDVKKSEVHGMSQRGGAVDSHVRFGKRVYAPMIPKGEADVIFSLETMETLRFADYAAEAATAVYLNERILPGTLDRYPDDLDDAIAQRFRRVIRLDKAIFKKQIDNRKARNIGLVGALSTLLPIPLSAYEAAITHRVPREMESLNQRAFKAGRALAQKFQ